MATDYRFIKLDYTNPDYNKSKGPAENHKGWAYPSYEGIALPEIRILDDEWKATPVSAFGSYKRKKESRPMFGFPGKKYGFFVLDVDKGFNVVQYAVQDGAIPEPMVSRKTGSGGYHLFYRIRPEELAKAKKHIKLNGNYEFTHYDIKVSGQFRYECYAAVHPTPTIGDNSWPNQNGAIELYRDLAKAPERYITADFLISVAKAKKGATTKKTRSVAKAKKGTSTKTRSVTVKDYTPDSKYAWTSEYNETDNERFAYLANEKGGYIDTAIKHLNADTDYVTWMQTCSLLFQIAAYDKSISKKVQTWCTTSRNPNHEKGPDQTAALYIRNKGLHETETPYVPIQAARRLEWMLRNDAAFNKHMEQHQKYNALKELKKERTAAIAGYDVKRWVAENCLRTTVPHTDREFMVKQTSLYGAYKETVPKSVQVSARRFHRELRYIGFVNQKFSTFGFTYYTNLVYFGAVAGVNGDMRYSKVRKFSKSLNHTSCKNRVESIVSRFATKVSKVTKGTKGYISKLSQLYYMNSEDRKAAMSGIADMVSELLATIQRNALEPEKRFVFIPNRCYSF